VKVITYYELNPDLDPSVIGNLAAKFVSKGMYPAKGVKNIAWYNTAADYWGIAIDEVENEEAFLNNVNQFRIALPGIFKVFKSSLVMDAKDVLPALAKLEKQVKGK
jgi:hypothetical protein